MVELFKKKNLRFVCLLLVLAMFIGATMTAFAAESDEDVAVVAAGVDLVGDESIVLGEMDGDARPMSLPENGKPISIGDTDGTGNGTRMVEVFHFQSGYRGPITVKISDFNPGKYRVRIMIYGTNGLLLRDDDWMGSSGSMKVINKDGSQAIQSVFIGIGPRPALFRAPYKTFQVTTSW